MENLDSSPYYASMILQIQQKSLFFVVTYNKPTSLLDYLNTFRCAVNSLTACEIERVVYY